MDDKIQCECGKFIKKENIKKHQENTCLFYKPGGALADFRKRLLKNDEIIKNLNDKLIEKETEIESLKVDISTLKEDIKKVPVKKVKKQTNENKKKVIPKIGLFAKIKNMYQIYKKSRTIKNQKSKKGSNYSIIDE